jgi:hypothetical protein
MSSQTIAARTTATRCVRGYVHATPAADLGAESAFALLCGSSSLYYLIDELSSHEGSEARRDRDLDAALGSRDQGPARLDPPNHRWRRETRCPGDLDQLDYLRAPLSDFHTPDETLISPQTGCEIALVEIRRLPHLDEGGS